MDLLDWIRQETRDKESPDRKDTHGAYGREAQALLLGRLYPSLQIVKCHIIGEDSGYTSILNGNTYHVRVSALVPVTYPTPTVEVFTNTVVATPLAQY